MKIKELNNKIAHIAFSPGKTYPSFIASGTAAEQLDSSFNTKSRLDLLKLDLANPSIELELCGSLETESRFSKLIWSDSNSTNSKNLIIGGCEDSKIYLFDYEKILSNTSSVSQVLDKHTGNVSALDINPFQHNLLASGASSSDIFIWDLNNPSMPMTPGAKLQPLDDINSVAWNNQVQHILASTSSGKCVVWDLRKNESIIKVSDTMSKMKAKLVSWHPEIATQMCLSSDDDHSPYLQIWDLRFATSPVRILEGHQRGILSFAWCSLDSNLLVSSGKDSRLLCWNPNNPTMNGEILYDLTTVGQWCFDLSWSKRNPDLICTSSFEGQVNVYSLMGGKYNVTQQTSSKIMDSFGVDGSSMPGSPTAIPQHSTQIVQQLKIAPKWMKRPCGAKFAFGGKLVTFGKFSSETTQTGSDQLRPATPNQASNQRVLICQVITDNELVENSKTLENALQTGNLIEYCNYKIENASNQSQSSLWRFILASFNQNKNEKFLELLGFNSENLNSKVKTILKETHEETNSLDQSLSNELNSVNLNGNLASSDFFDNNNQIKNKNFDDDILNDITRSFSPVNLHFSNETENLITELLLLGHYETVVDLLIQENRFTEAILIANFFDKNLLAKTQQRYFRHFNKDKFSNLLEKMLNRNWSGIISTCNLEHWKEALAALVSYTNGQEQLDLCDELGKRLEAEGSEANLINACVCYISSGNLENLVVCWQKVIGDQESDTSSSLQDIIEKVMVLKFCFQNFHPELAKKLEQNQSLNKLNSKLVKYAKLLADQGCFLNAYNYINDSNDHSILVMKDRLYHVIDPAQAQQYRLRKPEYPFKSSHQTVSKAKSNSIGSSNSNSFNKPSIGLQANKNIYQKVSDPSVSGLSQNNFNQSINPNTTSAYQTPYNPYQNSTSNNTPFLPVATVNHPMPISSIYTSQDITNRSATPVKPLNQPPPISSSSQPLQSTSIFNPSIQNKPAALSTPAQTFYTPSVNNSPPQNQTEQPPQIQSYMHAKPATAWNDPPVVAPKIKAAQPAKETEMPTFFQPTMQTSLPPGPASTSHFYPQTQSFQPNPTQLYQQPIQHHQTFENQGYNQFHQQATQQQQQQQPIQQTMVQQEKPAPIEKGPVPSEHQIIQNVFDTLLNKCLSSTNVPTTKRKLDDVSKKLEILYDKLRDSTLSGNVAQGLHSIIQYMQVSDYQSSLTLHSNIVATSNFTEISGFMPGIKVLIQSCQQMNITL